MGYIRHPKPTNNQQNPNKWHPIPAILRDLLQVLPGAHSTNRLRLLGGPVAAVQDKGHCCCIFVFIPRLAIKYLHEKIYPKTDSTLKSIFV